MISIDGLTVEFSGTTLFKDISFTIGDKDRIALMGKNGAGKSTLLKIIAGEMCIRDSFSDVTREGITIAAPGFYAPQGRWVRLEPHDARLNEKIESFGYEGRRITNFEMEGSALAGLAALMGHRAATICTIIAQRIAQDVNTDYKPFVRKMIETALDKLAILE